MNLVVSEVAVMLGTPEKEIKMPYFCVNKVAQSNGDHEVHDTSTNSGCLPSPINRQDLGYHAGCASAVQSAKIYYAQVNGCRWCAPSCHTG